MYHGRSVLAMDCVLAGAEAHRGRPLNSVVMRHKGQLQVIETTRFAEVVRAFAAAFPNAVAKLDRKIQSGSISKWCTNANLKAANDFSLIEDGVEVLGFHDGPRNMWAPDETLHLLNELAARKVLRLGRPAPKRVGLLQRLFRK